jgi:uncharacterized protein
VTTPADLHRSGLGAADVECWRDQGAIARSPVYTRSVIGLFGIAAATVMVTVDLAGWRGSVNHLPLLFPFARTAGGIAHFLAGMWAYCALTVGSIAQFLGGMWAYHVRDALATAMHGLSGSFGIVYGLYTLLEALGVLPPIFGEGSAGSAYGFWFVVPGAITWIGVAAATTENVALASVLTMLATGCTLLAIGLLGAHATVLVIGAHQLIASGLLAWYLAKQGCDQAQDPSTIAKGWPATPSATNGKC